MDVILMRFKYFVSMLWQNTSWLRFFWNEKWNPFLAKLTACLTVKTELRNWNKLYFAFFNRNVQQLHIWVCLITCIRLAFVSNCRHYRIWLPYQLEFSPLKVLQGFLNCSPWNHNSCDDRVLTENITYTLSFSAYCSFTMPILCSTPMWHKVNQVLSAGLTS